MKFTAGTKRFFIAQLHANGLTPNQAYSELRPKVAEQVRPWIFSVNGPNGRTPKPMAEQYVELQHEINRVFALLERIGNPIERTNEIPVEETPKAQPVRAKGKRNVEDEKTLFVSEWRRIRKWIADTSERTGALPIDSLDSMRPIQGAKAMIEAGVSAAAMIYAMTLHWPQVSREMAGIETVDFKSEAEALGMDENGRPYHAFAGYVLKLAQARLNIMLIGPAGTGKSHLAKQVASMIKTEAHPDGLPYGETPMTPGATRGDLLGRMTASPDKDDRFILSQFVELYSGGGIFNFEEIDAADAGMLIVVNNALASSELFNPINGERYERHPDFICVSTANTFGLGADSKYSGREKLDLATIDRFRMGRVVLSLDESLADSLMSN